MYRKSPGARYGFMGMRVSSGSPGTLVLLPWIETPIIPAAGTVLLETYDTVGIVFATGSLLIKLAMK